MTVDLERVDAHIGVVIANHFHSRLARRRNRKSLATVRLADCLPTPAGALL